MAACWRAAAAMSGVELYVIGYQPEANAPFGEHILRGVPHRLLSVADQGNVRVVRQLVLDANPDVLLIAGWLDPAYVSAACDPALARCRIVMGMDTPWKGTLRQRLARYGYHRYFRRVSTVLVAGERAFQLAVHMGFDDAKIRRGLYGIDYDSFATAQATRSTSPAGWPKRFAFIGRYCPEKGLDLLVDAYAEYRRRVSDPWELVCCGRGPQASLLSGVPGVSDLGFRQPETLPEVLAEAGALVLPSLYEPWGVVVAEACAAGLPIICSNACGAAVDLVREGYNGYLVGTGDVPSLAEAMVKLHRAPDVALMGRRSQALAQPFSASHWPSRALGLGQPGQPPTERGE